MWLSGTLEMVSLGYLSDLQVAMSKRVGYSGLGFREEAPNRYVDL